MNRKNVAMGKKRGATQLYVTEMAGRMPMSNITLSQKEIKREETTKAFHLMEENSFCRSHNKKNDCQFFILLFFFFLFFFASSRTIAGFYLVVALHKPIWYSNQFWQNVQEFIGFSMVLGIHKFQLENSSFKLLLSILKKKFFFFQWFTRDLQKFLHYNDFHFQSHNDSCTAVHLDVDIYHLVFSFPSKLPKDVKTITYRTKQQ